MSELKRCPFCGGKARMNGSDNVNGSPYWYVYCADVETCGCNQFGGPDKEAVIEKWNRRVYESSESAPVA